MILICFIDCILCSVSETNILVVCVSSLMKSLKLIRMKICRLECFLKLTVRDTKLLENSRALLR